jgi:hypothetical protein
MNTTKGYVNLAIIYAREWAVELLDGERRVILRAIFE